MKRMLVWLIPAASYWLADILIVAFQVIPALKAEPQESQEA